MAITLITGVPGTGKTAFVVSELEKIAATGRKIFVDNIPDLKIPHYRAGKISSWQKGTWLHIDIFKRSTAAPVIGAGQNLDSEYGDEIDDDNHGDESWQANPDVLKDLEGNLQLLVFDNQGKPCGSVPYESHKGALLVIDEGQRHFRPRPAGSPVPDHVAALEVHRKQLDIWIITQRPGLIDSNVRGLCGRHIALRETPFGRYKYEWPEVGDIESKTSRDTAARTRYKLPKHVFDLYKSAEVHTDHKHTLPLAAKILAVAIPVGLFFLWSSYKTISGNFHPDQAQSSQSQAEKPAQVSSKNKAELFSQSVEDWRIAGIFELSGYPVFVLKNQYGKMRRLIKPAVYTLNGFDSTVNLPEGGMVTYYTSFTESRGRQ